MKHKKSFKRNLIEWGIIISVPLILFITGLHTSVVSGMQRLVLFTGVKNAEKNILDNDLGQANYNFILEDLDGRIVEGESFRGKTVFLNLWASWCPPCRAEMPGIENLYEKTSGKNIDFIFISFDEERKKAEEFIKDYKFRDKVYFLKSSLPSVYASSTIPTTFVISPSGTIKFKEAGMANYDTDGFLKALLSLEN